MFTNSSLLKSCANRSQWPDEEKNEVLMCGKSNVGKSSLINALCNRKNLAYVGKTPGKTRLLNFFDTNMNIRLVDAPGYGYYVNKANNINDFAKFLEEYFKYRNNFKAILLLVDGRRDSVDEDDMMIVDLAVKYHKACIVVITKADKMKKNEITQKVNNVSYQLALGKESIIVTSSEKKTGIEDLYNKIITCAKG